MTLFKNRAIILVLLLALIAVTAIAAVLGIGPIKPIKDTINLGLDIEGGVVVVYEGDKGDYSDEEFETLMKQSKAILSKRVDSLGLTEPNISIQGEDRIRIELPGVKDVNEAVAIIGKTALLEFALVSEDAGLVYPGMTAESFEHTIIFNGDNIKDAGVGSDEYGKYAVTLELSDEGTDIFADTSRQIVETYAGGTGQIAIMLDSEVISAPSVSQVLSQKDLIIQGTFTLDEVVNLSTLIRGGALPLELEEVQTSLIGPTIGLNALSVSVKAAIIGFILVVLFMIGYYRLPGLLASLSLILYVSLVFFTLVYFGATLTLPGIAGLVLSIGMAVDANVIIFERIKEELRNGKSLNASVDSGFKRAMRTIMDSNVTTLIAAVVLFNFGEGPIQGFAVTLMIGIAISMLTAIIVTRLLIKSAITFDFLRNKKYYGA